MQETKCGEPEIELDTWRIKHDVPEIDHGALCARNRPWCSSFGTGAPKIEHDIPTLTELEYLALEVKFQPCQWKLMFCIWLYFCLWFPARSNWQLFTTEGFLLTRRTVWVSVLWRIMFKTRLCHWQKLDCKDFCCLFVCLFVCSLSFGWCCTDYVQHVQTAETSSMN